MLASLMRPGVGEGSGVGVGVALETAVTSIGVNKAAKFASASSCNTCASA